MIQEENRPKFWNFNSNPRTIHRSPKYTSLNSSYRETLDANICVTFNYINRHPRNSNNSEGFLSPDYQKISSGCVSPIRMWKYSIKVRKNNDNDYDEFSFFFTLILCFDFIIFEQNLIYNF